MNDELLASTCEYLKKPSSVRGLLSFDFDGTLFHPDDSETQRQTFFDLIRHFRQQGFVWGINTGRDPEYLVEGLIQLNRGCSNALRPDFFITMERYVYLSDQFGHFKQAADWNIPCASAHKELFEKYGTMLTAFLDQLTERYASIQLKRQDTDPFSLVSEHASQLDRIVGLIQEKIDDHAELVTQRAGPYLRFSHRDFNKGTALGYVLSQWHVDPKNVVICGDGHNDLDAMITLPEAYRCAPQNAVQEVKNMVQEGHGYVSPFPYLAGVSDALVAWQG